MLACKLRKCRFRTHLPPFLALHQDADEKPSSAVAARTAIRRPRYTASAHEMAPTWWSLSVVPSHLALTMDMYLHSSGERDANAALQPFFVPLRRSPGKLLRLPTSNPACGSPSCPPQHDETGAKMMASPSAWQQHPLVPLLQSPSQRPSLSGTGSSTQTTQIFPVGRHEGAAPRGNCLSGDSFDGSARAVVVGVVERERRGGGGDHLWIGAQGEAYWESLGSPPMRLRRLVLPVLATLADLRPRGPMAPRQKFPGRRS